MKKGLLILSILFSGLLSRAQNDLPPVDYNSLSIRGNMAYYQGRPFTGIGYTNLKNGRKALEIIYRNGYIDGNYTKWWPNGKKKFDDQYSQGKMLDGDYNNWAENGKVTETRSYKNGYLSKKVAYKDGLQDGPEIEFFPSSANVKVNKNFVHGLLTGPAVYYNSNGSINTEEHYNVGKRVSAAYYDDNHRLIKQEEFDQDGKVITVTEVTYGNQGDTSSLKSYDNNQQLNGLCYEKWEDGSVKWKRKYNHGNIEQSLIENKNDPARSIKAVYAKNSEALIGVAPAISANPENADHANLQIVFDIGDNISNREYLISSITSWLFNYRLKHVNPNSPEPLNAILTISDFGITVSQLPGSTAFSDRAAVIVKDSILSGNYPTEVKMLSWKSNPWLPLANYNAALTNGYDNIGSSIANYLYDNLPVRCAVASIKDSRKNGMAKTVIINGGSEIGIYNHAKLRVFDVTDPKQAGGNIIAHLEVIKDLSADHAVCKVLDGEAQLTQLISSGKQLKALLP